MYAKSSLLCPTGVILALFGCSLWGSSLIHPQYRSVVTYVVSNVVQEEINNTFVNSQQTMAAKPFIVVNSVKKRFRRDSGSSGEGSESSPSRGPKLVYLSEKIPLIGGFSSLVTPEGEILREVYGFPVKHLTPKERELNIREFVAKLYSLKGDCSEEVDNILARIAPVTECQKTHSLDDDHAGPLSGNLEVMPPHSFRQPEVKLAPSTPGPRVAKVKNISTTRSPGDSLKIINHLMLSEDDARYIRGISLVALASEYSVSKVRREILGNNGNGWVKAQKVTVKTWYREEGQEIKNYVNGEPAKKDIVIASINKNDIVTALQHFADIIVEQGQYVDLQTFDNCPEVLRDCVVVVMGNDSGAGYTREGVRFVNRVNGNAGCKVFVTTLMIGSDKSLSCFQKQALFSSLSALRNLSSIKISGQDRKLLKISCSDYEAAAQEVGTQVCKYILIFLVVLFYLNFQMLKISFLFISL